MIGDAAAAYLETLGFLHGILHHIVIGLLDSTDAEIDAWAHFLNLYSGKTLSGLLGRDHVRAQLDLRRGLSVFLLSNRNVHHILQTLDINIIRILALEEIQQKTLGHGICVCDGRIESGAGEGNQWLQSHSSLCAFELRNRAEGVDIHVQFQHFQHFEVEESTQCDRMRAFL